MVLPALSDAPAHHPDCCLSLSGDLFSTLTAVVPEGSAPILSIGSGSGLLEAYLASRAPSRVVEGVEVSSTVNRYLGEERAYTVGGTWDLCPRAKEAIAWIFVYPRDPGLVKRYFEAYGRARVQLAVYLGPRADWADFQDAFKAPGFAPAELVEDCGLVPYEMMAIIKKDGPGA